VAAVGLVKLFDAPSTCAIFRRYRGLVNLFSNENERLAEFEALGAATNVSSAATVRVVVGVTCRAFKLERRKRLFTRSRKTHFWNTATCFGMQIQCFGSLLNNPPRGIRDQRNQQ